LKHKIFKSFIIVLLLLFINLAFSGCYYTREASLDNSGPLKIEKIEMKDGRTIYFNNEKVEYAQYKNNKIVVYKQIGKSEKIIPFSEVKKIYVKKLNKPATYMITTVGFILVVLTTFFYISLHNEKK